MKQTNNIFVLFAVLFLVACSGSRKYFKAAEKLEKQGLVNDAAGYYLESLQRKPTNVEARIKLKEVGQKHLSNLASDFFRNYNTQQLEATLESFERLKEFNSKTEALNVHLDYPKTYDEDYQKTVETYCAKNYDKAHSLVNEKKYAEAILYLNKITKYNSSYKNAPQLSIIATCEPLYQSAINNLENKNYTQALILLQNIKNKTENYKDSKDLYELATAQQTKSFILFEPNPSAENAEKDVEEILFNNFSQLALQKNDRLKIINNTPFQNTSGSATDLNNNANVDLIQAIRKATAADFFYVFDVINRREYNPGATKTAARAFQEVRTKKNDTLIIIEYKPLDYNIVKAQRSYSYDFKYKIINAYNNQIVASNTQTMRSQDVVEFQEFQKQYNGNINSLFPYNPEQTPPAAQYNPRNWRSLFTARNTLKTLDELRNDVLNQNGNTFLNTLSVIK